MTEDFMNKELKNKKLMTTYQKNGFTVKIFQPDISEKERKIKDIKIKGEILNLIKNLNLNVK